MVRSISVPFSLHEYVIKRSLLRTLGIFETPQHIDSVSRNHSRHILKQTRGIPRGHSSTFELTNHVLPPHEVLWTRNRALQRLMLPGFQGRHFDCKVDSAHRSSRCFNNMHHRTPKSPSSLDTQSFLLRTSRSRLGLDRRYKALGLE